MEDVLAVYEKPYQTAEPVICLDEKPVSLHADVRPPRPARPGKPARPDNEYKRCGTANVFGAVEPKAGRHFTTATPNRCAAQFAHMVNHIVDQYPAARTIHLIMDNLNIHCGKSLVDSFGQQKGGDLWDRLTVHYTPKHGSCGYQIWARCSGKRGSGTARPTASGQRSTGSLRARRPGRRSTITSRVPTAEKHSHPQHSATAKRAPRSRVGRGCARKMPPQAETASQQEFSRTAHHTPRYPATESDVL